MPSQKFHWIQEQQLNDQTPKEKHHFFSVSLKFSMLTLSRKGPKVTFQTLALLANFFLQSTIEVFFAKGLMAK